MSDRANSDPPTKADYLGDQPPAYYVAQATLDQEIEDLVDAAPSQLDTLNELAAALEDNADLGNEVTAHMASEANPHNVDYSQTGAIQDVADVITAALIANDAVDTQHIVTDAVQAAQIAANSVGTSELSFDPATQSELDNHANDTNNPHNVTTFSGDHADLSGVGPSDHHAKPTSTNSETIVQRNVAVTSSAFNVGASTYDWLMNPGDTGGQDWLWWGGPEIADGLTFDVVGGNTEAGTIYEITQIDVADINGVESTVWTGSKQFDDTDSGSLSVSFSEQLVNGLRFTVESVVAGNWRPDFIIEATLSDNHSHNIP